MYPSVGCTCTDVKGSPFGDLRLEVRVHFKHELSAQSLHSMKREAGIELGTRLWRRAIGYLCVEDGGRHRLSVVMRDIGLGKKVRFQCSQVRFRSKASSGQQLRGFPVNLSTFKIKAGGMQLTNNSYSLPRIFASLGKKKKTKNKQNKTKIL